MEAAVCWDRLMLSNYISPANAASERLSLVARVDCWVSGCVLDGWCLAVVTAELEERVHRTCDRCISFEAPHGFALCFRFCFHAHSLRFSLFHMTAPFRGQQALLRGDQLLLLKQRVTSTSCLASTCTFWFCPTVHVFETWWVVAVWIEHLPSAEVLTASKLLCLWLKASWSWDLARGTEWPTLLCEIMLLHGAFSSLGKKSKHSLISFSLLSKWWVVFNWAFVSLHEAKQCGCAAVWLSAQQSFSL